ncbi:hypothetical protein ACFSF0_05690 [Ottowia flava]|uniref:Uncharacterized protein n=1 Tax=Ottowia flava TaxID=2675430 RepID=A0ABW4KRV9_9BURK|nr:hypothetical protein [Ottowia sp. GY511]
MLLFRWLILLLLLVSGVCFAYYAATGQPRFRAIGWVVLKWTLLAALGFFAVLIAERVL